jgi:predicted small lipoprotein YifL
MSTSTKTILALCTFAFLAACGAKETETVYIEDTTVSTEPTYTGKYK